MGKKVTDEDWFHKLDIPEHNPLERLAAQDPDFPDRDYLIQRTRQENRKRLEEEEAARRKIRVRSLDQTWDLDTHWLWHHRIPLADFTIVGGRASIGKSLFLCTLCAWITQGDIRGAFDTIPRNVIYIANEDSYERTVVPRLRAAGADLSRVFAVEVEFEDEPSSLMFPRDLDQLTKFVEEHDIVAVVVDPISSNMTDKDRNSPEVRRSYERLRRWSERTGVALIGNGHLKKGQFKDFLEGFMGSSEIGNVARAAIGIALDPDADRTVIISQCKNNNGPMDLKSYTYRVTATEYERPDGSVGTAPRLIWGESTDRHVNDIFSEPASMDTKSDTQECKDWLREYLHMNPGSPRAKVVAEGRACGHKEHTIKRAAKSVAESRSVPNSYPRRTAWYPKGDAPHIGGSS